MRDSNRPLYARSGASCWPHRLAVVTACTTLPLLFIGGLVTSKGAGLAVPDWPTTFGYNMFLYPWSKMVGNIFYEHGHRLVASAVGLLTIALALSLWFQERRAWLRWLGIGALAFVIGQGVIGGLRVVLLEHTLAIVHAAVAQFFFAITVSLALFTSSEWREAVAMRRRFDADCLRRLCALTTGLIYIQIIFGAILRHTGRSLDAHLLFAGAVAVHVILVVFKVARSHLEDSRLTRPAFALGLLLALQLALGLFSYLGKFTPMLSMPMKAVVFFTTTHLVVGSLMLATSLTLALRVYRLSMPSKASGREEILKERYSV
jgi:cytochrome c oxidase assembly protein subunit 15